MVTSLTHVEALNAELHQLVRSGIPLEAGLAAAGKRGQRSLQGLCERVQQRLEQGESLEQILDSEASVPDLMVAAVAAGVRTGQPAVLLEILSDYASEVISMRSKVVQAATYPLIILTIICWLLFSVAGHYSTVLLIATSVKMSSDQQLSAIVLPLLRLTQEFPEWVYLPPALLTALVAWWIYSGRSSALRFGRIGGVIALLPGMRVLITNLQSWGLCRLLLQLVRCETPFPDALTCCSRAIGPTHLGKQLQELSRVTASGDAISQQNTHCLPPLLSISLIQSAGDEQLLIQALSSAEVFYRNRFDQGLMWYQLLLSPAMFLLLGGGGVLIYSLLVFWPIVQLYLSLSLP